MLLLQDDPLPGSIAPPLPLSPTLGAASGCLQWQVLAPHMRVQKIKWLKLRPASCSSRCSPGHPQNKSKGPLQPRSLRTSHVLRNVISYNSAISAGEKDGQRQHALGGRVEMRRNDALPDGISCSSGISACAKGGQWQLVHALVIRVGNLDCW